jgi:hypothetical protein
LDRVSSRQLFVHTLVSPQRSHRRLQLRVLATPEQKKKGKKKEKISPQMSHRRLQLRVFATPEAKIKKRRRLVHRRVTTSAAPRIRHT